MATWRPLKDGYGRTTGYMATFPNLGRVVARNTGGRRSTGNWVVETIDRIGTPTVWRDRGCSLRSAKQSAEQKEAQLADKA